MYTSQGAGCAVRLRIAVEKQIVIKTVADLLAAGYKLTVDQGDGETTKPTTDVKVLHDALMETDEDFLHVYKDKKHFGWVRFVYGNDGWDVISDYTTNLEAVLKGVNEFASAFDEGTSEIVVTLGTK